MNFTHLILLKKSPWFIYSTDEESAIKTANFYPNDIVGVVVAKEGLEVKIPKQIITLVPLEIKEIKHFEEEENEIDEEILKEVCNENKSNGSESNQKIRGPETQSLSLSS